MPSDQLNLWENQIEDKWLPFAVAREFARSLNLYYKEDWEDYVKGIIKDKLPLPEDIPENPEKIFKYVGWKNWKDWLIDPKLQKQYTIFFEAREFVRCLRLKNKNHWYEYINQENPIHLKFNLCIPEKPNLEYQNKGWQDWNDWFGKNIEFRDFSSTRKFVRSLKLKSVSGWKIYCKGKSEKFGKKPKNIFAYPEIAYKNKGWESWEDWLGIDLFMKDKKEMISDLPEGALQCRCKGLIPDCTVCDGKGYYFP